MNIERASSYFRKLLAHLECLKTRYKEEPENLPAGWLGMRAKHATKHKQ